MKREVLFLLMFSLLALLFAGCNKDETGGGNDTPSGIEMAFDGELKDVTIEISGAWTAKSDQTWCQLSQMSGKGNEKVQVNAAYNRGESSRTATIIISASSGSMKRGSSNQTIVVTQEGNPADEIPPHFTDVKFEDGTIWFKYWTGQGGNVVDAEGYGLSISKGGVSIADRVEPEVEIDWGRFYKLNLSSGKAEGKLSVGNVDMANTVRVDQSQTFREVGGTVNTGSCEIHFTLNGKLYYGGGYSERGLNLGMPYNIEAYDFYCYDPAGNSHRSLNNLPFAAGWAFVFDGAAYVALSNHSLYKYDVGTDSWTLMQILSIPSGDPKGCYAVGSTLYVFDEQNRYEYAFLEDEFKLQSTASSGAILGSSTIINDGAGSIWLSDNGKLYKHSNSGYTMVQDGVGNILGAYAGAIYYMKNDIPYRLTAQGNEEILAVLFDILLENGDSSFKGSPKTVTIDGDIYWVGGMHRRIITAPMRSVNNFCCFSAKNYMPMNIMLVTDN